MCGCVCLCVTVDSSVFFFHAVLLLPPPPPGMAVVFFPATLDGTLDSRLLHAAEPAVDTKWVSQIWIRQGPYSGTPTARIPRI